MQSRTIVFALSVVPVVVLACSTNSSGYASLCPEKSLNTCAPAPDATGCSSVAAGCGLDALPTGLPCSGPTQCSMPINPIPNCSRTDGYICSCTDGRWSCDDCFLGAALCEAGASAATDAQADSPSSSDVAADGPATSDASSSCPGSCAAGQIIVIWNVSAPGFPGPSGCGCIPDPCLDGGVGCDCEQACTQNAHGACCGWTGSTLSCNECG